MRRDPAKGKGKKNPSGSAEVLNSEFADYEFTPTEIGLATIFATLQARRDEPPSFGQALDILEGARRHLAFVKTLPSKSFVILLDRLEDESYLSGVRRQLQAAKANRPRRLPTRPSTLRAYIREAYPHLVEHLAATGRAAPNATIAEFEQSRGGKGIRREELDFLSTYIHNRTDGSESKATARTFPKAKKQQKSALVKKGR